MKLKSVLSPIFLGIFFALSLSRPPAQAEGTNCQTALNSQAGIDELREKIERCGLLRIDEVIPLLSEQHRAHYTLMHHSQSLHEASPDNPRAILFGTDGRFIVTFNGEPGQVHYGHLVIMQYQEARHRFEMYDIQIAAAKI